MGGGVSADRLPQKIDHDTFQMLLGNAKETEELFQSLQKDGIIPLDVFVDEMKKRFHVFLTHDWSKV